MNCETLFCTHTHNLLFCVVILLNHPLSMTLSNDERRRRAEQAARANGKAFKARGPQVRKSTAGSSNDEPKPDTPQVREATAGSSSDGLFNLNNEKDQWKWFWLMSPQWLKRHEEEKEEEKQQQALDDRIEASKKRFREEQRVIADESEPLHMFFTDLIRDKSEPVLMIVDKSELPHMIAPHMFSSVIADESEPPHMFSNTSDSDCTSDEL